MRPERRHEVGVGAINHDGDLEELTEPALLHHALPVRMIDSRGACFHSLPLTHKSLHFEPWSNGQGEQQIFGAIIVAIV